MLTIEETYCFVIHALGHEKNAADSKKQFSYNSVSTLWNMGFRGSCSVWEWNFSSIEFYQISILNRGWKVKNFEPIESREIIEQALARKTWYEQFILNSGCIWLVEYGQNKPITERGISEKNSSSRWTLKLTINKRLYLTSFFTTHSLIASAAAATTWENKFSLSVLYECLEKRTENTDIDVACKHRIDTVIVGYCVKLKEDTLCEKALGVNRLICKDQKDDNRQIGP